MYRLVDFFFFILLQIEEREDILFCRLKVTQLRKRGGVGGRKEENIIESMYFSGKRAYIMAIWSFFSFRKQEYLQGLLISAQNCYLLQFI